MTDGNVQKIPRTIPVVAQSSQKKRLGCSDIVPATHVGVDWNHIVGPTTSPDTVCPLPIEQHYTTSILYFIDTLLNITDHERDWPPCMK